MTCELHATPNPVAPGGILTISITGATPNATREVTLDNGEGTEAVINIDVDEEGNGSTTWTVPSSGWDLLNLTSPPCHRLPAS